MRPRARLAVAIAALAAAALASSGAEIPPNERRSAYEDMSRDNKAMQEWYLKVFGGKPGPTGGPSTPSTQEWAPHTPNWFIPTSRPVRALRPASSGRARST